jgi:hypothetical protein
VEVSVADHIESGSRARGGLLCGGVAFLGLLLLVLLMLFTPLLSGTLWGVGVGYLAGVIDFLAVLAAAAAYCRSRNRAEDAEDTQEAGDVTEAGDAEEAGEVIR